MTKDKRKSKCTFESQRGISKWQGQNGGNCHQILFSRLTFKSTNSIKIIEDVLEKHVNCTYF